MSELADILIRIVEQRRRRLGEASDSDTTIELPTRLPEVNDFLLALEQKRGNAVIAEIKMGSPKLGNLEGQFDAVEQAKAYADNGAAALSVVVEPDFFFGSYELLKRCQEATGLPAIAKDFVVHDRQLYEAYQAGASAILLIAAMHTANELLLYARRARSLGLVPLIETHSQDDVDKLDAARHIAGALPWELVGVNNRDLRTFEVDLEHSVRMVERLPDSALLVAESGIHSRADIKKLAAGGFDAFLIGETLLLADDPGAKLRELLGN